ncbi:hypothetical protein PENSPDRAFT_692941 [Peniophora sp. CONT]|nr:hypothetical protein PENSPDRAFT_692941 [Peniophora sp. CONT]
MLTAKLQSLHRLLTGAPFEWTRDNVYPRFSLSGISLAHELKHSKNFEKATLADISRVITLAQRDVLSIENDLDTLREARNAYLRCRSCQKFMKLPLFVDGCKHAFCRPCLVQYLREQRAQYPAAIRHRCPADGCPELMREPPREIPAFTVLSKAIWVVTRMDRERDVNRGEWCPETASAFSLAALFKP